MFKKGFMKTVEAVIAVVIVLFLVYALQPKEKKNVAEIPENVENAQRLILRSLEVNGTLRSCVNSSLSGGCAGAGCPEVQAFIDQHAPSGFVNACEICDSALSCMSTSLPTDRSVFTGSVFVMEHAPKVVRVYFWSP